VAEMAPQKSYAGNKKAKMNLGGVRYSPFTEDGKRKSKKTKPKGKRSG